MRVFAKVQGFYGGARRRAGTTFEMSEKDMKDGKLPSWVVPATPGAKENFEAMQRKEADKAIRAGIAASGQGVIGKSAMDAKTEQFGEAARRK